MFCIAMLLMRKNNAVNANLSASTYRGSEGNFSQVKNLSFPNSQKAQYQRKKMKITMMKYACDFNS